VASALRQREADRSVLTSGALLIMEIGAVHTVNVITQLALERAPAAISEARKLGTDVMHIPRSPSMFRSTARTSTSSRPVSMQGYGLVSAWRAT
jgi:hypothetical protein